jgi:hypothetical protein
LEVREDADHALFSGQTVFDDVVADEEGLHRGFEKIRHETIGVMTSTMSPMEQGSS